MDVVFDFGWMSVLIIAGQFCRSRSRWLRATYLPTAMIAGCFALIGGPQVLDWIPFRRLPDGPLLLSSYPTMLVVILFTTMFLSATGVKRGAVRQSLRSAGDTLWVNLGLLFGQYGLALTLGVWLLRVVFPEVPAEFALLMPASFAGGPGTVAAVAGTLQKHDLAEALPVGLVLATIGLVAGNVGGMLLVNLGIRAGWTRLVKIPSSLALSHRPRPGEERQAEGVSAPGDLPSDFLSRDLQPSLGRATIHPSAMEALTWPIAVVLSTVILAHGIQHAAIRLVPVATDLPLFVCAIPAALVMRGLLRLFCPQGVPDSVVIGRIGALATDYLVAFGIASVKLTTLRDLGLPILLLAGLGLVATVLAIWIAGRRLFRSFWFERSIFAYGWMIGVVATGVALLRSVDPESRTKTLDHFGLAYVIIGPADVLLIVLLPWLVVRNHFVIPGIVLLAMSALCFALSALLVGVFTASPTLPRADENL